MSFDGVARPSMLNPYADPLSASLGAHEAARETRNKPRVEKKRGAYETIGSHKDLARYSVDEDEQGEGLSEEEREQVLLFARLRGLMNFSLDNSVLYRFVYNPESGRADLVDDRNQRVMLSLTIDELLRLSQRMVRYAGMIADKSA
ncbi:MAG: hypothetical protein IPK79_03810 [Vampirovibrionales bacterium]|nr:hypothetical protein [Vampirovibrionales bacterium]